jgi:hypothetical protein
VSVVSRRAARPPAVRRFNGVLRFTWMRLRGIPREAARGCLEMDSETFMLDDLDTVPTALVPQVRADRHRHRRRHRLALGAALGAVIAAALLGWAF